MKHLPLTLLLSGLFALTTATADVLTLDEVIAGIDGDIEESDLLMSQQEFGQRVNFDVSTEDIDTLDFWKPENAGLLDDTYY